MKKRIRNMRWHFTKKRWTKQLGEFKYNARQNFRRLKKGIRQFFTPKHRGQVQSRRSPALSLLLALFLTGILFLIWHYSPAAWRMYKSWSAYNNAKRYWREGNAEHAFWSAQVSSYNSAGRDKYDNLVILAKASRAINHYTLLEFQKKLALSPLASVNESILLVELALDRKNYKIAEKFFPNIAHLHESNSKVKLLKLRLMVKNWRTHKDEALKIARELIHENKIQSPDLDYIFSDLCLRDNESVSEGLSYVYNLAHRKDKSGLIALRQIFKFESGTNLTAKDKERFFPAYRYHPLAERDDKLAAFSYGFRTGLINHSEIDIFIEKTFKSNATREIETSEINKLFNWLNEIGLPHKLLSHVPVEAVKKDKFSYINYLNVLINSGEIKKARSLLEGRDLVFSRAERHLLLSITLKNQGAKKYSDSSYELGVAHATPSDLPVINYVFDQIPHSPRLVKSLKKWSLLPEGAATSKALLLKVYYNQNDEEAIKDLLENMRTEDYKKRPRHLSRLMHMKILHREDLKECIHTMEQICSSPSNESMQLLTLSLAYLLDNKAKKALKVLEECQIDYLYKTPGNQAIAGVILDANNRTTDSRYFLKDLDPSSLYTPERQLLTQINTPFLFKNSPLFQEIIQN